MTDEPPSDAGGVHDRRTWVFPRWRSARSVGERRGYVLAVAGVLGVMLLGVVAFGVWVVAFDAGGEDGTMGGNVADTSSDGGP